MNKIRTATGLITVTSIFICWFASIPAQADNDQPLTENWAPGEWGPDDKVGAVNRTTPEIVLKAVGLVKRGKVATLGKVYQQDMPLFGSRIWSLTIPGLPTYESIGPQDAVGNDELVTTAIGQVGTQFDGAGRCQFRSRAAWAIRASSPMRM